MCNNDVKAIMKKIYSFLFAATALFAASSCQKEVAPEVEAPEFGKITFTASTEAETKTALHENGKSTTWVDGDKISVFDANKGDNNRCFEIDEITNESKTATFSYEGEFVMDKTQEDPTVVALHPYQKGAYCDFFYYDRNYITGINFPAEQTAVAGSFDPKAAVALGLGTMETMELGFQNLYTLLKFTVTKAGVKEVEVTFDGDNAYVAGDAKIQMNLNTEKIGGSEPVFESPVLSIVENGSKTVKLSCEAGFVVGTTYYIAVAPASYTGLSVALNGNQVKESSKANTLVANKIYNLGDLTPASKESTYGLVGSFQGWDVANPVKMLEYGDGWAVAENVELYKNDEFKFAKDKSWTVSFGGKDALLIADAEKDYTLAKGGQNIRVTKNGKFDLYFNLKTNVFKYTCVEEYTDLMVNITIDNKANWSPLYITLKDGDNVIADNVAVTDNKYQISGDYIGSTLTCTLSNGTKTSDVMNLAITKNGATVTLEETVIKLKVQLNTANAKQWWGNTMKIHVWDTGTSFDTSWPGNTMTSEGNYTWSIIVPSELEGKTIKFLVHNGNGWQSSDSKVTIKAEGNTVTGSSIGIN
jgi:hypothetical protein